MEETKWLARAAGLKDGHPRQGGARARRGQSREGDNWAGLERQLIPGATEMPRDSRDVNPGLPGPKPML